MASSIGAHSIRMKEMISVPRIFAPALRNVRHRLVALLLVLLAGLPVAGNGDDAFLWLAIDGEKNLVDIGVQHDFLVDDGRPWRRTFSLPAKLTHGQAEPFVWSFP